MANYIVTLLRADGSSENTLHENLQAVKDQLEKFFTKDEFRTFVVNETTKKEPKEEV